MYPSVYAVDQVRELEEAAMAALPEGALIQRAAFGLAVECARLLRERRGRVYGARVLVLAGMGNNGGDARLAARYLTRWGASVAYGPGAKGSQAKLLPDLVIDGLVGIGGQGAALRGEAADAAELASVLRERGALVVAVDVPSGVDASTGEVSGIAVTADVTVTFGWHKVGNLVTPGAWHAGEVRLVEWHGLDAFGGTFAPTPVAHLVETLGEWPKPEPGDNKYTRGVVGIVAGSIHFPGAAMLAVGGALSSHVAGMVRYVGPVAELVVSEYPEVIASDTLKRTGRVQAWGVGPGLGIGDGEAEIVHTVLSSNVPVVCDADALTMIAQRADLADAVRRRKAPTILTPHEGEFERLAGPISGGRLQAAQNAARHWNCVVVLKGDRTIVAPPGGSASIGPGWTWNLAMAGTGDVLTGILSALLAAGVPPLEAAAQAVAAHAQAGRRGAARTSDLVHNMRHVRNSR